MPASRTAGRRAGSIIAIVLIAAYIVVSLIIVIPGQSTVRSAVTSATSPLLNQRWSMFAPHPLRSILQLEIRAEWRDESGELTSSEWVDVSALERREVTGNPLPSRVQEGTWNAISLSYMKPYYALTEEQRSYALEHWFVEGADGIWSPTSDDQLVADMAELGDQTAGVNFIRSDYTMMRFATLFATAYFDQDIERIQWRIEYIKPNEFAQRFEDAEQFDNSVITFGLRDSNVEIDPEVVAAFRAVIERRGGAS